MRVLVAGGGFAGLLAARRLAARGIEVEVWEASDQPGGWVQTEDWPGPGGEPGVLERGPQELRFRTGDALERLVRELDLTLLPSPSRDPRWLVREGRRLPQPRGLRDLLTGPGLSLETRVRLLLEPLVPVRPAGDLEALLRQRLGRKALRELAEPLLASLVPRPLGEVGLEAIPGLSGWNGSLASFARIQAGLRAWVPRGGVGALSRALAEGLGSRLNVGRSVEALVRKGEAWDVWNPEGTVRVDGVVLALPVEPAARLLEGAVPEAAALIREVPSADLMCWHSRHPGPNPWPRGFHLAAAPGQAPPVLGGISLAQHDRRGVDGCLQLRTYLQGLEWDWPEVEAWLGTWVPGLLPAVQVRVLPAPGGFAVPAPGHGDRCRQVDRLLPSGLVWTGAGRLGAGLGALTEGLPEGWNPFASPRLRA